MGDKEWTPTDVSDLFGDELARRILVLTSERPLSADDLADHLDAAERPSRDDPTDDLSHG